jgi:hypothetical protein
MPVQRCTVHKYRILFGHALERLHEEISADYYDMPRPENKQKIEMIREGFILNWRPN